MWKFVGLLSDNLEILIFNCNVFYLYLTINMAGYRQSSWQFINILNMVFILNLR